MTVIIYDTTLRDGAQGEGISFSLQDRIEVLRELDEFGIDFVECGWPGSNPMTDELFAAAKEMNLNNTKITAFGSTRRRDIEAKDDANLNALIASGAKWACIFGKTWDFQVEQVLNTTKEENLAMIRDSVSYLTENGMQVMFDAEHFFDGYASDSEYALAALEAAAEAGAEWLVLCETNGGAMPYEIEEAVSVVKEKFKDVAIGIHCHNDTEMAVANSISAVKAGATMVQGCINGIGERTGNANLCSIIPNVMLKMGRETNVKDLSKLTGLSKFVGEVANVAPPSSLPYVGENAFAHKGGTHVSALMKDTRTYEHIDPSVVGNRRKVLISDLSGRASILEKLSELGITADKSDSGLITETVKELESKGYQFEGADASFELLVMRMRGEFEPYFNITGFRLFIDEEDDKFTSEASIKIKNRDGEIEHTASDGDGPVNALDNALRKALSKFFPIIDNIRLSDYKVRVLDEKSATAATVRVLIRSTDGSDSWTTVGVSQNVIEASLIALVDSLEYAIMINERKAVK